MPSNWWEGLSPQDIARRSALPVSSSPRIPDAGPAIPDPEGPQKQPPKWEASGDTDRQKAAADDWDQYAGKLNQSEEGGESPAESPQPLPSFPVTPQAQPKPIDSTAPQPTPSKPSEPAAETPQPTAEAPKWEAEPEALPPLTMPEESPQEPGGSKSGDMAFSAAGGAVVGSSNGLGQFVGSLAGMVAGNAISPGVGGAVGAAAGGAMGGVFDDVVMGNKPAEQAIPANISSGLSKGFSALTGGGPGGLMPGGFSLGGQQLESLKAIQAGIGSLTGKGIKTVEAVRNVVGSKMGG